MRNLPQRSSKINDIYMQQKTYDMHVKRLRDIARKPHLQKYLSQQASSMDNYVRQLKRYKKQTKSRHLDDLQHQNNKIITKLIEIQNSRYHSPNDQSPRHFNSYWTERKMRKHRLEENMGLVQRLISTESLVPKLRELKKDYRESRKLSENCKRFPAIKHYEDEYRKRFSSSKLE